MDEYPVEKPGKANEEKCHYDNAKLDHLSLSLLLEVDHTDRFVVEHSEDECVAADMGDDRNQVASHVSTDTIDLSGCVTWPKSIQMTLERDTEGRGDADMEIDE